MGAADRGLTRGRALDELASRSFDVLVVGGGVVGASVAAHAARHGLAVALVEADDFGGATSSASSKLVHGGLRYLRLGDVRLVREAHAERRVLERRMAPHLVHRIPFLLPLRRGGPHRPLVVQSGVLLYAALARERPRGLVGPARAASLVPGLRTDGLRSCAAYTDAWTNDARLCLATVRAAAEAGATVLNGARLVELRQEGGVARGATVEADGALVDVRSRAVVNASGPWVDELRRLEDSRAGTSVRLSKGAHVLLDVDELPGVALTIPQDAVRVSFAVPWFGMLLLGTTDQPFDGPPTPVEVTGADVRQILSEAGTALDLSVCDPARVRSTYAGLRVLPLGEASSAGTRRETVYARGPAGMLSVAGGKLTTFRKIGLDTLERLRTDVGLHRVDREPWPLPGAGDTPTGSWAAAIDPAVRAHLLGLYGALAPDVVACAAAAPELLERIHPDGPDILAQAAYAFEHEWARSADDIVRRRTTVAWRGLDTAEVRARLDALRTDR